MPGRNRKVPLLLWPFYALWLLLSFILIITGRLLVLLLGGALMAAGAALTLLIISAPLGIPLFLLGLLLVIRGIF